MKNKTCYKKGNVPWNKDTKGKGIMKPNKTSFKTGVNTGPQHKSWKGGVQVIADDCVYLWKRVGKRIRRPREIYKQIYGPIPKGYIIYHIDKNKHNDKPSNLKAISRAELLKLNQKSRLSKL